MSSRIALDIPTLTQIPALSGSRTPVVQFVVNHFTDSAVPILRMIYQVSTAFPGPNYINSEEIIKGERHDWRTINQTLC